MFRFAMLLLFVTTSPAIAAGGGCDALSTNAAMAAPLDVAALSSVRSVQIIAAGDCTGLNDLTTMTAAASAARRHWPAR